jgi:hypothetical protein
MAHSATVWSRRRGPASAESPASGIPVKSGQVPPPLHGEKDVFSTERTRISIAIKGLNIFKVLKTNWFLSAKEAKTTQKSAQTDAIWAELNAATVSKQGIPTLRQAQGGHFAGTTAAWRERHGNY